MDLLRSTIETLFYRFPLGRMAEMILDLPDNSSVLDDFVAMVAHYHPEFTISELDLLGDMIGGTWLSDEEYGLDERQPLLQRLPLLLCSFAGGTLSCSNLDHPKVRFQSLLRWRALTLLLGEDLFSLPYLARMDESRNLTRTSFDWPNVLGHDNFRLNVVLKEMLSDTHSHINAAIDVFEFNWICLMNMPHLLSPDDTTADFLFTGLRRNPEETARYSGINLSLSRWIYIGAAIRLMLFCRLNGMDCAFDTPRILSLLRRPFELAEAAALVSDAIQSLGVAPAALNISTRSGGRYNFDYAFAASDNPVPAHRTAPSSPYLVHAGERKLLYRWLRGYYGNKGRHRLIAPLVILYLLIKSKIRREYIQTNELVGFRNFQLYQRRKSIFLDFFDSIRKSHYGEIAYRYAVQTSIGPDSSNHIEARVTPSSVKYFRSMDPLAAIFVNGTPYGSPALRQISFVAHFIKSRDTSDPRTTLYRHYHERERYWAEIKALIDEFSRNGSPRYPDVTGIDAAGNELGCRPEVFAPMFRYARHHGISHFTFHAGEDFYDIAGGLRYIDEAVDFLDYSIGDRIGHGLALGTDPYGYYTSRHHLLIIPRQEMLDNVVWLKYKAMEAHISLSPDTELLIERYFNEIGRELGYFSISQSMYEYYLSMKLRGDIIDAANTGISDSLTGDVCHSPCSRPYLGNGTLARLHAHYEHDARCRGLGIRPLTATVSQSYPADISRIQEAMLHKIESKGIVIETNPSSNLKIGRFDRYDQHPITLFHNIVPDRAAHSIVVSVNTDDKGVFATSLENEYSLLAIALMKSKTPDGQRLYSDGQIEDYLRRIARYSNISRFAN